MNRALTVIFKIRCTDPRYEICVRKWQNIKFSVEFAHFWLEIAIFLGRKWCFCLEGVRNWAKFELKMDTKYGLIVGMTVK